MRKAAAEKTSNVAPARASIATDGAAVIVAAEPLAKTRVKALPTTKKPLPVATLVTAVNAADTPAPKALRKAALKSASKLAADAVTVIEPVAKPAPKRAARKTAPVVATLDTTTDIVRERAHKTKLVRDSFTMPEHEYAVLGQVKKACLKAGFEIKKSELLRIGVALISQLDLATLQSVLAGLPQLKTGRPNKV